MKSKTSHVTRCLVAGIVALLPMGGAVFSVVWLEAALTASWRDKVPWYFPGLGLVLALLVIYGVGLFVTTFAGRWLWRRTDRALERLPFVGTLYQSLKEVLGYDSTRERFFRGVVALRVDDGYEIGFVTGDAPGPDGTPHALVFVPSSPNPTNGRLVLIRREQLLPLDVKTADALRALVSMGKTPLGQRAQGAAAAS
ncbi:MAG: DUF502 domain-containing protein [Planctomycetes bacterium]|nr:DUF502 domain-containing protein [Planctomycetota bacterium]MCC7397935.1 DUF502 domain-containing protein [Planctomycetota bacterium]